MDTITYKQIFTDKVDRPDNDQQYLRITLYAPDNHNAPYLWEETTGDKGSEDWATVWCTRPYCYSGEATYIRQAIKRLDGYFYAVYGKEENEAVVK
jgi:hypothetical protein